MNITPRKILMIHGDKRERGTLAIMLTKFGHTVSFADEAQDLVLSSNDYDLIIVDEILSEGIGFVLLNHFSQENRNKTIFLSFGDIEERRVCKESMDLFECMAKPVVPIDLAVVVCDFFISRVTKEMQLAPLS